MNKNDILEILHEYGYMEFDESYHIKDLCVALKNADIPKDKINKIHESRIQLVGVNTATALKMVDGTLNLYKYDLDSLRGMCIDFDLYPEEILCDILNNMGIEHSINIDANGDTNAAPFQTISSNDWDKLINLLRENNIEPEKILLRCIGTVLNRKMNMLKKLVGK